MIIFAIIIIVIIISYYYYYYYYYSLLCANISLVRTKQILSALIRPSIRPRPSLITVHYTHAYCALSIHLVRNRNNICAH